MKTQIGKMITGDVIENTMTFEIEYEMTLQAGMYAIVPLDNYDELIEMIKVCKKSLATYGKHPIIFGQIKRLLEKAE